MMKSSTDDTRTEEHHSSLPRKRSANKSKSKEEMMIHLLRLEKDRSRLVRECKEFEETTKSTQAAYIKSRATLLMEGSFLRTRMDMLQEDTGYLKEKSHSLQAKFFELNIEAASKEHRIKVLETAIQENSAQRSDRKEPPSTESKSYSLQTQLFELNIEAASKEHRITKVLETAPIQEHIPTTQKSDRKEAPTAKSMERTQQIWRESRDEDLSISTVSSTLRTLEASSHTPAGFEADISFNTFDYGSASW
jgi:hypothetical protein